LRTRRSGPEPFLPNDLESQRERALAAINAYIENPPGDDPGVAETTDDRRNYHMKAWRRYGAISYHLPRHERSLVTDFCLFCL
jgi:hypothetical protein